jgi:chemotaxis protein CheD
MLDLQNMPRVNIRPGEQFVANRPTLISTILGSCVAACLWDPLTRIAGMNHFMLVNNRYARNMPLNISEAGRYGIHAMELLINELMRRGADRKKLRAKAFGGGKVFDDVKTDNFFCVGEINVRFIQEFLDSENIPLDAADLGGDTGKIIRFRTDTFQIYRKNIVRTASIQIEFKEYSYWQQKLAEPDRGDVVFFNEGFT